MSLFGQQSQPGMVGPFKSRDTAKNDQVNQVNVNFQDAIMSQMRPVQRMLAPDGSFAPGALASAGSGFPSKDSLFQFLRNNYPSDRGINMEALDATHLNASNQYNEALQTAFNTQRAKGMSERKLRNKVGEENPDLLGYAIQQGFIEPKVDGVLDDFLVALGAGGTALGGAKLYQMSGKPSSPGKKSIRALRNNGFNYDKKTGRITKMTSSQIKTYAANKAGGVDFVAKEGESLKKVERKTIGDRAKIEKRLKKGQKNLSGVGKQAIKKGGSKRIRNIATNMALKNVGKHFGAKAAAGIAAKIAGGLFSWPLAVGLGAAQLAPLAYKYFKDEE